MAKATTPEQRLAMAERLLSTTTVMQSGCALEPNTYEGAVIGASVRDVKWNDAETGEPMSMVLQDCKYGKIDCSFPINLNELLTYKEGTTVTVKVTAHFKGNRVAVVREPKAVESPANVASNAGDVE